MKKILFITGTRADYGKIKSLLKEVEADPKFELHIFVSGMHLVDKLGSTYREVLKDKYENILVCRNLNTNIKKYINCYEDYTIMNKNPQRKRS